MTSALIGLALILLIAAATVALGMLSRLLAARIVGPSTRDDDPLTPLERLSLGNELIARDLQPDSTHPVARTAARDARVQGGERSLQDPDLALRYCFPAAHALR